MKSKKKSRFYTRHIDLIKIRLNDIKDYILEIESKFESDMDQIGKQLDKELKKKPLDPESKDYLIEFYSEDYQKISETFLSTFRYSVLVSIYSIIETEMNSLCRHLKHINKLSLELTDLKGDGIGRAKLYLEKVCNVDFPDDINSWANIQKLNKVRNCIVHAEGNVERVHNPAQLKNIIKNTKGLKLVNKRRIFADKKYLENTILHVEDFLAQLCNRVFV